MRSLPRLEYTDDAYRDFKRCRQFLRRQSPGNVSRRMRELMNAVRGVRANPEISPVRKVDPVTLRICVAAGSPNARVRPSLSAASHAARCAG
jgi:plasmid stabilization system protein ParE